MIRLALILSALAAAPAAAFTAQNGQFVRETGGLIEVEWRGESGAPAFWCAAGDYVIRRMHLPSKTRIFRVSAPPRRAGESILFSLDPQRAVDTGLVFLGAAPRGLSAGAADDFCDLTR